MKKYFVLFLSMLLLLVVSCKHPDNTPKFTVYSQEDGLKVVTTCDTKKYAHSIIEVYDLKEGSFNLTAYPENINEFVYPYVEAGKDYEVLVYLYDENWNNSYYVGWADITAAGGEGDYRVTGNGMKYDGNETVTVSNYEVIRPSSSTAIEYSYGYIYTTAENDVWVNGKYTAFNDKCNSWNLNNSNPSTSASKINNSEVQAKLNGSEKNFWFSYYMEVHTNKDNSYFLYSYTPYILFTNGKAMEKFSTPNNMVKVEVTSEGFNIEKWYNSNYPNVRITVYNETKNYECPRVVLNTNFTQYTYDYLNNGDVYSVYLDYWDANWTRQYHSEINGLKAKGGKGDLSFEYTDAKYVQGNDSELTAILRLSPAAFIGTTARIPGSYDVNGNLWLIENNKNAGNVWDSYDYDASVANTFDIDLSKVVKKIMGKQFWPELVSEWEYNGLKYQLTLIDNDSELFTDSHVAGTLELNKEFNVLPYNTTFKVPEEFKNKKAFLIKYNKNDNTIADSYPVVSKAASTEERLEKARKAAEEAIKEGIISENSRYEVDFETIDFGEPIGDRVISRDAVPLYDYSDYKVDQTTIHFAEIPEGKYATLKAIGKHCNVWYYNNNNLADEVLMNAISKNKTSFQTVADKFDNFFDIETYLIGSNIPTKVYSDIVQFDESLKIDIFIFDLDELYYNGMTGGTYGYFSSKDFLNNYATSNERQMFYIDSAFLGNDTAYMYSTLAHEFQHLLLFVNKWLNKKLDYSSWFTEMMSLGIEDALQVKCLNYNNNEALNGRVSAFNGGYFLGFVDWKTIGDSYSGYYNYANAAVFMDYLMKNYGGVKLLYEMAHNNYIDEESVTKALKACGFNETFDSVMLKMGSILPNAYIPGDISSAVTVNKDARYSLKINGKDEVFEFNSLDLTKYAYGYPSKAYTKDDRYYLKGYSSNGSYAGPTILKPGKAFKNVLKKAITVNYITTGQDEIKIGKTDGNVEMAIMFADAPDPQ